MRNPSTNAKGQAETTAFINPSDFRLTSRVRDAIVPRAANGGGGAVARLDLVEFVDNPEPRCPCVLVLDTSGSMSGAPIERLNEGLVQFGEELNSDPLARLRVEIAVVTFGRKGVVVESTFCTADEWVAPTLTTGGVTPMGEAIDRSVDLLDERKDHYKSAGIEYFRPWMIIMTDGAPTDDWAPSAARLHRLEATKSVVSLGVGVAGADFGVLAKLSPRAPKALDGLNFGAFFVWLSESQRAVSASVIGEQVPLPPTTGWESVG